MDGLQVKKHRKALGYNTQQFANALGLRANGYRTIERIEAGGTVTGPMRLAVMKLLDDAGLV
jgi:transcriptional regulator with XRE-family HTH domain